MNRGDIRQFKTGARIRLECQHPDGWTVTFLVGTPEHPKGAVVIMSNLLVSRSEPAFADTIVHGYRTTAGSTRGTENFLRRPS